MCRGGDFNLSYKSLTSRECQEALKNLKKTDPEFYTELTQSDSGEVADIDENINAPEDNVEHAGSADYDDDTTIPIKMLVNHVQGSEENKLLTNANGDLSVLADAETDEIDERVEVQVEHNDEDVEKKEQGHVAAPEFGRGKRAKKASKH